MNVNRKVGTGFEKDLCRMLSKHGFWAHNLTQNSQGQPFDVIAARNGVSYPIDCKVCDRDKFVMLRIEENQYSSMRLWEKTGNGVGWFALRLSDGCIYFISSAVFALIHRNIITLCRDEIEKYGVSFDRWVAECK